MALLFLVQLKCLHIILLSVVVVLSRIIYVWCFLVPSGEPHMDGEPGDLKFIIRELRWLLSFINTSHA